MSANGSKTPNAISRLQAGEIKEYTTIDYYAGIEAIRYDDTNRVKIPAISNKADEYLVLNNRGEIHYLLEYQDHKLATEYDLDDDIGIHKHTWITTENSDGSISIKRDVSNGKHEELSPDEQRKIKKIWEEIRKNGQGKHIPNNMQSPRYYHST